MKHIVSILTLSLLFISLLQAQDTIYVDAGWNMIGYSSTVSINGFTSEPAGIITSSYYGYRSGVGYSQTDTLTKNKGYWVKANQAGILIGGTSPAVSCGEVVLYGGRAYNTVLIGSQCWFRENLNVGSKIGGTADPSDNSILEKYCYDNDTANCNTYGGLYEWNEAMQYTTASGAQGICPTGWHIPSYGEMQTLGLNVSNYGNGLKAVGQGAGGGAGTNTSGFSALLSGARDNSGSFYNVGGTTYFWSSTEFDASGANYLVLYGNNSDVTFSNLDKNFGFSVRCLKD